jgi:hypothetical protein
MSLELPRPPREEGWWRIVHRHADGPDTRDQLLAEAEATLSLAITCVQRFASSSNQRLAAATDDGAQHSHSLRQLGVRHAREAEAQLGEEGCNACSREPKIVSFRRLAVWVAVHSRSAQFTRVRAPGLTCGVNACEPR